MTVQARFCAAAALLLLGGACSQEASEPANQQQAAEANQMTADPANPYADAEMQMGRRMMAAVGQNAADTWVRKMIEHHRGGIEMSEMVIAQGGNAEVSAMARRSAEAQRRDIGELERLLGGGTPQESPAAEKAKAEPAPKVKAAPKAAPKEQPKAAEPKAAEPKAPASEECAPEHRAAGHC